MTSSTIGEEKDCNTRVLKPRNEFKAFMEAQHLQKPFDLIETVAYNKVRVVALCDCYRYRNRYQTVDYRRNTLSRKVTVE